VACPFTPLGAQIGNQIQKFNQQINLDFCGLWMVFQVVLDDPVAECSKKLAMTQWKSFIIITTWWHTVA
jgi:hypothetical protein